MQDDDSQDRPLGEPVQTQPGVLVERRCFLRLATTALAVAAAPGSALAGLARSEEPTIDFETFLAVVVPEAKRLVGDVSAPGQDRYLHAIAAHAVRLGRVPRPAEWRDSGQGTGPGTFIGVNPGGDPFVVLHWRMEPGTVIRDHAHTYGTVVTLGLEGSVRVRNHEVLGEPDFEAKGSFRVRRTREQVLRPGGVNLVSLERDYVHGFTAGPEGARGLDITTRIAPKRPTPWLELAGEPLDARAGIYEARWTS